MTVAVTAVAVTPMVVTPVAVTFMIKMGSDISR